MKTRTGSPWLLGLLLAAFVGTLTLGPLGAEDMDTILNQHIPSGTGSGTGTSAATPAASPAAPATASPTVSTPGAPPKELEAALAMIEKILSLLEGIAAKIPEIAKAPAKDDKYPCQGTVRVNTSLNIRTSPWGKIIGSFHEGDQVRILGREGAWYRISWHGRTVYCHANYIDAPGAPAGHTPVVRPGSSSSSSGSSHPAPEPVSTGSGRFGAKPCQPMPSRASSEFGMRRHPTKGTYSMHNGIDLPVPTGTRLNALGDGVVTSVGYEPGGGNFIIVKYDNGLESFYCHLQRSTVKKGQRVSMGQEIAKSDNTGAWTTGPHLHMAIKKGGKYINPRSVLKLP